LSLEKSWPWKISSTRLPYTPGREALSSSPFHHLHEGWQEDEE
jgi:hypothetical protein